MRPASAAIETLATGGDKSGGIADDVIGGERQNDRILVAHLRKGRAGRDRRAGIPPHRLQQDIGLKPDLGKLLEHHEPIGGVGDDDRTLEQSRIRHPQQRILKCRTHPEQRQELLGMDLARSRPQPRSGAAAHDQWNDTFAHCALLLEIMIVTIPFRKPRNSIFNRGRRPESDVAREILDIGIGCRHVAWLHRQHLLDGCAAELLLKQ